ncbi:MAG: hypothetical protein P8099_16905 [Gemmatimonadota bacterium]
MKPTPFKTTLLALALLGPGTMANTSTLGARLAHAAAMAGVGAAPAAAQEGLSLHVVPRFGILLPDAYLYEQFAHFGAGDTEWTVTQLGRAGFGGVAVELGLGQGVRLRAEAMRSFRGWAFADHVLTVPDTVAGTTSFEQTWFDLPYRVSEAGLQLLLPLRIARWGVRPYVLAGGVVRWYHFGDTTRPNTVNAAFPPDAVMGGTLVGGGVRFALLGLGVDIQGRDAIGRYYAKTQHDVALSAGVVWRVF